MLERGGVGGQAGTSARIENYPGFPEGVSGRELVEGAHLQARRFGAEFLIGVMPLHARPRPGGALEIELTSGPTILARTGVIATGVEYRRVGAAGVEELLGSGVYYGSAPGDAPMYRARPVAVVGGANSAGQAALHLAQFASRVTLLVRAEALERRMSRYLVERIEANEHIEVLTGTELVRAEGEGRLRAIAVRVPSGERVLAAEALFIVIGGAPLTAGIGEWLRLDENGYLMTGPDLLRDGGRGRWWPLARDPLLLETSQPGVFVAGDVRHGSVKRVASAVGEGAMAVSLIHMYLSELARAARD